MSAVPSIEPTGGVVVRLDSKGRCCGKKPVVYKRKGTLFCCRCDAEFDIATLEQRASWAWRECEDGGFQPVHRIQPTGNVAGAYVKYMALTGGKVPAIRWQHQCPSLGAHRHTNEHDSSFLKCRCWSTADFLAAQARLADKQ